MILRDATPSDVPVLAAIFRECVLALGPLRYAPEQVGAWASFADTPTFAEFILKPQTFVAEDEQGAAGFCGVMLPPAENAGHIASLYVRPDCGRRGVGSMLLRIAMEHGIAAGCGSFDTEASEFSLALFQRAGFALTETEEIERRGVMFRRYLLRTNPRP